MGAAYLDQVGVAFEAEEAAAGGSDALRGPDGVLEEDDFGVEDGLEAGEAVLDLGGELGVGGFVLGGWGEGDGDAEFLGDAGDGGSGGFGVGGQGDGFD